METVCSNNGDTTDRDLHTMNGTNTPGVDSKNTSTINNVDVVNNNESHKTGKKKKNSKKDKSTDKTGKDLKINDVPHTDESSEESTDTEAKQDTEIIFIRDLGFNVKIVCPGTEAFEIQVC